MSELCWWAWDFYFTSKLVIVNVLVEKGDAYLVLYYLEVLLIHLFFLWTAVWVWTSLLPTLHTAKGSQLWHNLCVPSSEAPEGRERCGVCALWMSGLCKWWLNVYIIYSLAFKLWVFATVVAELWSWLLGD